MRRSETTRSSHKEPTRGKVRHHAVSGVRRSNRGARKERDRSKDSVRHRPAALHLPTKADLTQSDAVRTIIKTRQTTALSIRVTRAQLATFERVASAVKVSSRMVLEFLIADSPLGLLLGRPLPRAVPDFAMLYVRIAKIRAHQLRSIALDNAQTRTQLVRKLLDHAAAEEAAIIERAVAWRAANLETLRALRQV